MPSVVVDTHTALWYLAADPSLSAVARRTIEAASQAGDPVLLPAICLVEVAYLVEKGRIPASGLDSLISALTDGTGVLRLVPLDLGVALAVRRIPRDVIPDLPDRVIAATALLLGVPLVTRDRRIQAANVPTIW